MTNCNFKIKLYKLAIHIVHESKNLEIRFFDR